ncbi:MAG: hypothetical protein E6R06_15515 [Mycobacterium sp.]|nr:MAG: hypothetical protein E6R06_15515 [Mycobacterium sp.]
MMADSHLSMFVSNAWRERLGWDTMTSEQQETLAAYGLAMFRQGSDAARSSVRCDDIDKVKYEGRLVILEDGSRWEVDSFDVSTVDMWNADDKIAIIDGVMYNLTDADHADVSEED